MEKFNFQLSHFTLGPEPEYATHKTKIPHLKAWNGWAIANIYVLLPTIIFDGI